MRNVLTFHFTNDMRKDVGDGMCSILVDKSTNVLIAHLLIVATIHHSEICDSTVSTFLKVAELQKWTAGGIAAMTKAISRRFQFRLT
jgi:hypothetical protein